MKISIVIPTYNSTDTLLRALDSVYSGAGKFELEVIVVDDGSDKPAEEKFGESFSEVHCIRLIENSGKAAAVNAGISESSGDILIQLDSDDTLVEEWSGVVEALLEAWPEEVEFCLTSSKTEAGVITQAVPGYQGELTYEQRLKGELRGEYFAVFKGDFIRSLQFVDLGIRLTGYEEYSYLRFLQRGKCFIQPFVLRQYHTQAGNGLSTGWWQEQRAKERKKHLEILLKAHGQALQEVAPLEYRRKHLRLLAYRSIAGEHVPVRQLRQYFDLRLVHEYLGCVLLLLCGVSVFKFGVLNMQRVGLLRRWG